MVDFDDSRLNRVQRAEMASGLVQDHMGEDLKTLVQQYIMQLAERCEVDVGLLGPVTVTLVLEGHRPVVRS